MSFDLTTILDNISQGESFLQYFQLNNQQLNIDFNDKIISWSTRSGTSLIIFLNIDSNNLTSTLDFNINNSSSSIPKLFFIDQNGSNIGEVPFQTGQQSINISDYVSNTIAYDEINFKITETSNSINGTAISLNGFQFNKDGTAPIPTPTSTP